MPKYRGAFHLHSCYSYDSEIELPEMVGLLKSQGYSFALISEHTYNRAKKEYLTEREFQQFIEDCRTYSRNDFLLIPGLEFSCYDNRVHIVATPLYRAFPLQSLDTAAKILKVTHQEGALAILVHPFWANAHRFLRKEDFEQLDGFEVWNYDYQGSHGPSLAQYLKLRQWIKRSSTPVALVGLDLHQKKNVAEVFIEMDLDELKQDLIFQKIRSKDYCLSAIQRNFNPEGKVEDLLHHLWRRESDFVSRLQHRLFSRSYTPRGQKL